MSTEQKRSENEEVVVEKIEIEMEENNAFQLPDNAADCCSYDDDDCHSGDGDDYDDEPKPKPEPKLRVVRKYNKDCVKDRFRDYFMLDRGRDFVIPYSPVMGLPSYNHVYDDSPSDAGSYSYLSAIVDGEQGVLPPELQSATTSTSASTS